MGNELTEEFYNALFEILQGNEQVANEVTQADRELLEAWAAHWEELQQLDTDTTGEEAA